MKRYTMDALRTRRIRLAMLGGCCAGIMASAAIAQVNDQDSAAPLRLRSDYFGYSASVSTRAAYTDNIDLSRDGLKDDEYILSTLFTAGAIISKPRVTGIFLGDLDFSYLIDQGEFVVNQEIGAASTFTGADNWLYFDLAGSTSRQLLGENARFSNNLNAGRGQRANVHSYSASPYIYHQMPDQSAVELRYRFSQVFIDDNFFNDSRTHEATASYESGNLFERVRFRTSVYGNQTIEEGSNTGQRFEYQQGSVFTEAQLALSRSFSLSGAVGYDEIDTTDAADVFFDEDALSGVFWRAGFTANPGRRSRARIEYGRRYDDDFIDAEIYYELSNRIVFSAGANRTFETRAESNNAFFRGAQRQVLEFADRLREGDALSPRGVVQAANRFAGGFSGNRQTLGLSTTNSAYAALSGVYDRTQITGSGFYSDSDFGFRNITSYGGSLGVDHRLSRRLTGYGNLAYRHIDTTVNQSSCEAGPTFFGLDPTDPLFNLVSDCMDVVNNNGVTHTILGSIGASYRVYENVSTFVELSHTERFSENTLLEYGENSIIAGVTLEF